MSIEYHRILRDVFRTCQSAIKSDNRDGDAHALLANAYYLVHTINNLVISQTISLKLAAATIQHWNASPIATYPSTKNRDNGMKVYQMVSEDIDRLLRKGSLDATMSGLELELYETAIGSVPEIDEFAHAMPSPLGDWIPEDAPEPLRKIIEKVYVTIKSGGTPDQIGSVLGKAGFKTNEAMITDVRNHFDDDWNDHAIVGSRIASELGIKLTGDWSELSFAIVYYFKRGLSGGTIKLRALTDQLGFGHAASLPREPLLRFIDRYVEELAGWLPRKPPYRPFPG